MDTLTPARPALRRFSSHELQPCIGQVSLVHMTRPSMHSVTNHLTRPVIAFSLPAQRDGLPDILSGLDFTMNEQARRYVRPNRVRHPTDCMFASGCSPPRLAATQLPSATRIGHLLGKDSHSQIAPAPRRTHSGGSRNPENRLDSPYQVRGRLSQARNDTRYLAAYGGVAHKKRRSSMTAR